MKLAEIQVGERYIVAIARHVKDGVPPELEKTATVTALRIDKPTPHHAQRLVEVHVDRVGKRAVSDLLHAVDREGSTRWLPATRLVMTEAEHASLQVTFARLRTEQRRAHRQQLKGDRQRVKRLAEHGIMLARSGRSRVRYQLRAPMSDLCEALRHMHPTHAPAITAIEQALVSSSPTSFSHIIGRVRALSDVGGPRLDLNWSSDDELRLSVGDMSLEQTDRLIATLGFDADGSPTPE